MTVSGLACNPCCLQIPLHGQRILYRRVSAFLNVEKVTDEVKLPSLESSVVFPRIHVRDPYKRLGISREAFEDEIQAARNFLIQQYAGHKPSVDAIESAHDKIIMQKFYERKNPKIDIKKKVREMKQSRLVQFVTRRFQNPSTTVIIKTAIAFLVLGALTFLFPTEEGPTLQVAISLVATIYFIHERLKSKIWAFLFGMGSFIFSWLLGTFLMVSVIPPLSLVK